MADPIIPGNDTEDASVGELIGAFAANIAKGAFVGALIGARMGTWGMAAGLAVGIAQAVGGISEERSKRMQREYEQRFRDGMKRALEMEASKGGLGRTLSTNSLDSNFHHKLQVSHWMTKAQCMSFLSKVGVTSTTERERYYKAIHGKCYRMCHHWNSMEKMADWQKPL